MRAISAVIPKQVIPRLTRRAATRGMMAFGNCMPSKTSLSTKLLVDHFISNRPGADETASNTALEQLIVTGDVNSVLDVAGATPERRGRFFMNALKLIEHDIYAPVELSIARLAWLLPALQKDIKADPGYATSSDSWLFEGLAAMAAMKDNLIAQIHILELSNCVPESAQNLIEPISALGLCYGLDHVIRASRDALLDDAQPFITFKALAEVAAKRCKLKELDDDNTLGTLAERIESIEVLIRKFGPSAAKPAPDDATPTRSGKRRNPPKPRRDPP